MVPTESSSLSFSAVFCRRTPGTWNPIQKRSLNNTSVKEYKQGDIPSSGFFKNNGEFFKMLWNAVLGAAMILQSIQINVRQTLSCSVQLVKIQMSRYLLELFTYSYTLQHWHVRHGYIMSIKKYNTALKVHDRMGFVTNKIH